MKRLFCLAVATTLFAAPLSAAAQGADPTLEAFKKVCWSAAGDYNAALANAASDNWVNTELKSEPTDASVSITSRAARTKAINGADVTLLVTQGVQHTPKGGDMKVSTCKLVSSRSDSALIATAQAWIGSAQDGKDPTMALYYVKPAAGVPDHFGVPGANESVKAGGGFGLLKFQQDDDDAIIVYQVYGK